MNKLKCAAVTLAVIILLCSCSSVNEDLDSAATVTALSFCRISDINLITGSDLCVETGYVRAEKSTDARLSDGDIIFVSDDASVAVIEETATSSSLVAYRVTAIAAGETCVCAMTSDGKTVSERLKVIVEEGKSTETLAESEPIAESTFVDATPAAETTTVLPETSSPLTETEPPVIQADITDSEPTATDAPSPQITDGTVYSVNTKTKKIHLPNCSSVARIKPENLGTTDNPEALIAEGYTYCKNCLG